ncbi:uncharacterized protein N7500_009862 [Penicillium coprophilum]|uniref:uncharacterized protein n=1 Tax=Penicillium coprophilum TaxID=36646 RepID=UPI0023A5C9D1|nr:uncharacterized protein N7500_009862 [Penicillium coprophilum]KAJ5154423.1 hypothetical protein N7500_009862 [Penicillium coprophilum]
MSDNKGSPDVYKVFTPEFDTVAYDPLDPPKRYHTGIYIEKDAENQQGFFDDVTGDIIAKSGMRFEVKDDYIPVATRGILEALPRPTKQQGLDFWSTDPAKRNKLTWTKENGELYRPGEQQRPIMKCNEWTHQVAIPKLRQKGILH